MNEQQKKLFNIKCVLIRLTASVKTHLIARCLFGLGKGFINFKILIKHRQKSRIFFQNILIYAVIFIDYQKLYHITY